MLILAAMLLMGLLAAFWGFLMCFLPQRWERLTGALSFAERWTVSSSKRSHPIVRLGYRAAGVVILTVGCWFTYVSVSEMHLLLAGGAASSAVVSARGTLPKTSSPALTVLSFFIVIAGALMALFPTKALLIVNHFWLTERAVKPTGIPKIAIFVRLFGAVLVVLAIASLIN